MGTTTRVHRIDRLGALFTLLGGAALALLPVIVFKANRIVPGEPRPLLELLPSGVALAIPAGLLVIAVIALLVRDPKLRLLGALAGIAGFSVAIAMAADVL